MPDAYKYPTINKSGTFEILLCPIVDCDYTFSFKTRRYSAGQTIDAKLHSCLIYGSLHICISTLKRNFACKLFSHFYNSQTIDDLKVYFILWITITFITLVWCQVDYDKWYLVSKQFWEYKS